MAEREMTADDIGVGRATMLARRLSDEVYADIMDRRFLKWLFDPEHEGEGGTMIQNGPLYALAPSVIAEIREAWAQKIEGVIRHMFRPGGIQRTVDGAKVRGGIQHWFFKHLNDEQRNALFRTIDDNPLYEGTTHTVQRRLLNYTIDRLLGVQVAP